MLKHNQVLLTDLYQLTMSAGYFDHQMDNKSTFELFLRRLPENRSYLLVAGLEQALDYLKELHFEAEEVEYLKHQEVFKHVNPEFFEYLKDFRFKGEVWAVPEGTIVFPYEPILRVTGTMIEAQIVETYLLTTINFQTLIASKAARVCLAAKKDGIERAIIDFGSRRAHGAEAGVYAARASFIGGCVGTSNVYAGMHLDLPIFGTAAHAWTMAFDSEQEAFENYHSLFPEHTTLLIDTYDTLEGARKAVKIGDKIKGVRLDSGDFYETSVEVRKILDDGGLDKAQIVVSGDMNEYKIANLVDRKAPIDAFGVGTEMVTSRDVPALGGVYKLVEQEKSNGDIVYKIKLSSSKASYPGKKQVFRQMAQGKLHQDHICMLDEERPEGSTPLLECVMKDGQLTRKHPSIQEIKARAMSSLAQLPEPLKDNHCDEKYSVQISHKLQAQFNELKQELEQNLKI